jgi:hypothetical protein
LATSPTLIRQGRGTHSDTNGDGIVAADNNAAAVGMQTDKGRDEGRSKGRRSKKMIVGERKKRNL